MQHQLQLQPKLGSGQPTSQPCSRQAGTSWQPRPGALCGAQSLTLVANDPRFWKGPTMNWWGKQWQGAGKNTRKLPASGAFSASATYPKEFILVKLPPASPVSLARVLSLLPCIQFCSLMTAWSSWDPSAGAVPAPQGRVSIPAQVSLLPHKVLSTNQHQRLPHHLQASVWAASHLSELLLLAAQGASRKQVSALPLNHPHYFVRRGLFQSL